MLKMLYLRSETRKKLLSLSIKNALELKKEREIFREGKKSKQKEVLTILQKDLAAPNPAFDY